MKIIKLACATIVASEVIGIFFKEKESVLYVWFKNRADYVAFPLTGEEFVNRDFITKILSDL